MIPQLTQKPGSRVADLGCGRGTFARDLLEAVSPGGRVVGFDLDEQRVAEAREAARELRCGRALRFEPGDACSLDEVPDASFDVAVCRKLLIHLSRPVEALREMVRIVRPGGLVIAIEPDELAGRLASRDSGSDTVEGLVALRAHVHGCIIAGALTAGGGDRRLGPKLPALMREVGLPDPSLALDPILRLVPGQDPAEVLRHLDLAWDTPTERDLFTAGGGDEDAWQRWQQAEEEASRQRRQPGGTPWATVTEMLYVCAASKPGGDPIGP